MIKEYPYYTLIYKLDKKRIKELIKQFKPIIINMPLKNSYLIFKDEWSTNYELNQITDLFSEKERVKCTFLHNLSPLDYFTKNKKILLKKTSDPFELREILYKNVKLCNNFKISVALSVLNHFKPKKWLDISAGWGDRLLSAIFYDVDLYFSCDPNQDLHPCYQKMIKTFVPKKKQNQFIIHKTGFEITPIPYRDFDIVFSSPPFFDLETYSKYNDNSLIKYKTSNSWYKNFLLKSLEKAIESLKIGGHIVLYIGYFKEINQMQDFLIKKGMKYLGIMYFYDTKPRGMYVYKKILFY